jgi:hypothetical protein
MIVTQNVMKRSSKLINNAKSINCKRKIVEASDGKSEGFCRAALGDGARVPARETGAAWGSARAAAKAAAWAGPRPMARRSLRVMAKK